MKMLEKRVPSAKYNFKFAGVAKEETILTQVASGH